MIMISEFYAKFISYMNIFSRQTSFVVENFLHFGAQCWPVPYSAGCRDRLLALFFYLSHIPPARNTVC